MTLVYLARHGQTPLNEGDDLRGRVDPPLNETGQEQARRLGAVLGPRDLTAVVASPLRRAIQTAQPVADRADLTVVTDQCLLDRDYGPQTGVSKKKVIERWGSLDGAPGVEPGAAVRDRALRGLTELARRYRGQIIAVVSHDAVNQQDGHWAVLAVNDVPGRTGAGPDEAGWVTAR
jgi:broad specificity phosphatase PhoE